MALYCLQTQGSLHPYLSYEWLLTNGMGAFASSTVLGCNTRRYHGLLCAAMKPPVGRIMALNRIGEILCLDGKTDRLLEFSINQFGGTFHPRGDQYLQRIQVGSVIRWDYVVEGVNVTKEVQLVWQRNIVGVRYTLKSPAPRPVQLQLLPFVSLRDFHGLRRSTGTKFAVIATNQQVSVADGDLSLHVNGDNGQYVERPDWWYRHTYARESERGQDDSEDMFTPGAFHLKTADGNASITLWAGTEPPGRRDWDEELKRHPQPPLPPGSHNSSWRVLLPPAAGANPPADDAAGLTVRRLAHAAADFVVRRTQPDGAPGATILAGYPWFADWGRDTMISLPGLLLATGRFPEAAQVLCLFAQYVSQGMVPNRFDDYTNAPHYNTVDASLWFIHACHEYLRASGDQITFQKTLQPACQAVIDGYERGTRFHIAMDRSDCLISAGDPGTQLTWMDAKQGDTVFTPRHGKAVEINALWYNALKLMGRQDLAAAVAAGFVKAFWISPSRGLYDVIHGNHKDDSLRPNQIFAVSLPHSPLNPQQQQAVMELVRHELLTPYGLRTLSRGNTKYQARYGGDIMSRDRAYHNGTVWPWLIGPFLEAYLRVNGRNPDSVRQCRVWLQPLLDHLTGPGCIGQISEIFDGDEPHHPAGCIAQAWSVAEVLRMALQLDMPSDNSVG